MILGASNMVRRELGPLASNMAETGSSPTSPLHPTAGRQLLLGAQEEEEGLVTKLKKNCSSQQAGLRVCTRMLEKTRTGSTAKYLYQRKQSAPQLDTGAYHGSLHHPTLPPA